MKFSVQSATLPELSVAEVVARLAAHGYDAVEWRVHEEYHLDPKDIVRQAKRIKPVLDDHGLAVSCLMGYAALDDLDQHKRVAEACVVLGCKRFRPGAMVYDGSRRYRDLLGEAVERTGRMLDAVAGSEAKALIETHFGTIAPSASLALALVGSFDPERIGVNFDPANMIIEGRESWRLALDILAGYLDYVHAKNITWVREEACWRWAFASLEEGQVDWSEIGAELRRVGYNGFVSVEDFHRVPIRTTGFVGEDLTQTCASFRDVDERLAENLHYLRRCLAPAGAP